MAGAPKDVPGGPCLFGVFDGRERACHIFLPGTDRLKAAGASAPSDRQGPGNEEMLFTHELGDCKGGRRNIPEGPQMVT